MNFSDWTSNVLSSVHSQKKIEPLIPEVISRIAEIGENSKLSGDFEEFSEDFVDSFAPNLIARILTTGPENTTHAQQINSILQEFIKVLPKILFSGNEKLLAAIYSIITETENLLYVETAASENFSFSEKDSKLYKENVSMFISSDFLAKCANHFNDCDGIQQENDFRIVKTIFLFKNMWNQDLLSSFVDDFGDCFIEYVDKINGKQLRDTNEKEIMNIFASLIEFLGDSTLADDLKKSRFDYCVRMLKTEFLSKQLSALQTLMTAKTLTRDQVDVLRHEFVVEHLIQHLHSETFHGFMWLFKAMLRLDLVSDRNLEQLWNNCIAMHASTIDTFFREMAPIVSLLPEDMVDLFWTTVANSRTLPVASIHFIEKVANEVPENCKERVFNRMFKAAGEVQQKSYYDEVNKVIVNFLPKEESKVAELQTLCVSLLEDNKNVPTAMCCLEKLCQAAPEEAAKKMLSTIVTNAKNLRAISVLLLELIHAILQRFSTPLTEAEFKLIKKCLNSALDVAPSQLEQFFNFKAIASNEVITLQMKIAFLLSITKKKTEDSNYIHLVFSLFKFINKDKFDPSGLRAKTLDLVGLDSLWEFAKISMSKEVAENICEIYSFCTEEDNIKNFIKRCAEDPIEASKILVLERMMSIREGRITGRNQNRWDVSDPRVKVPVTGDFTGILLLSDSMETEELRTIMSGILSYKKENITMKIDGKACTGKLTLSPRSLIEVRAAPYSQETPFSVTQLPSHILMKTGLYKAFLPFLKCGNKATEERALTILNMLPTAKEVIDELKTAKPKWNLIFDKARPSQLEYYLSALGNLAQTIYANDFFVNGGAESFFNQLFYDPDFGPNLLVMTITSAIMNAQLGPGAELTRATMLINLSEEHVSFIFVELSEILSTHPESAMKLFAFATQAASAKPEIIANKSFKILIKKAVFHQEAKYRQAVLKLIHFGKVTPEIILPILRLSKTTYCTQYFQLLKECTPLCDAEDWNNTLDFFFMQFPSTTDFSELLEANYPPQQFVDGIFESLLAFPKDKRSRQLELLNFILEKILLSAARLYQPTQATFKLLRELSEEQSVHDKLLSGLSSAHVAYDGTQTSNIVIGNKYRGLKNLGATCYMNAALQTLFHIPEFCDAILAADVPEDSWLFKLQVLFAQMKFLPDSVIDTSDFASKWLDFDGNPINVREQQDSLEFLQTLLDRAEDEVKGITSMFQGEIINTIEGSTVKFHSESSDKFTVFPVEVQNSSNISESFDKFLLPDMLTGDNQYKADGIGKIDATQTHRIKEAPEVLIIQLKRFTYDLRKETRHKIGTKFVFPQTLDISSIASQTTQPGKQYALSGIILHSGTAQNGHYTTYTKTPDGQWYNFNDDKVTEYHGSVINDASGSDGMTRESAWTSGRASAYVLVYKQINEQQKQKQEKEEHHISQKVLEVLKPRLFYSLRHTVLTSEEYCDFFLSVCNDGALLFEYFTKCLVSSNGEKILDLLQKRLQVLVEGKADFANFIVSQNETHFNCLLISSSKGMRHSYAEVLCAAMQVADKATVDQMIEFLESKFNVIMDYWRNFDEFFLPFLQSVSMSGSNEKKLIPLFFDFLQKIVPEYAKKNQSFSYSAINLSSVFKLLVVLLSSPKTRSNYQSVVFSPQFLDPWFQSTHHAVAFSQLLRTFVLENNDLSSSFFRFFSENAHALSPAAAAGHFSVLIASHNDQTKKQIDWAFKFLHTKDDLYVKSFLASLIEKICESHIDFTSPMLDHASTWCNLWLMSQNPVLRKEVKKFTISVFESQNADKRVALLAEKLLDKLPELSKVTANIKSSWASKPSYESLESALPASTFYKVLKWTAKKQSALQKITDKSKLLVETLNEHKKLNMKNNKPRNSLLQIILLINPRLFFKHVDGKHFLAAFDDLSAESSLDTALSVIRFAAPHSIDAVTTSAVFKSTLDALICHSISQESSDFQLFVRNIIDEESAESIATALFTCDSYKDSLKKNDANSVDLSLSILRDFPETADVFFNYKCHETLTQYSIENIDESRFTTLLREFIDSFKSTNEGRMNWLRRPLMQPLITFLLQSQLVDVLVDRLSKGFNNNKDAGEIVSLLIAITTCSKSLAEKILAALTKHAGKVSSISPTCAQLISIASAEAPEASVSLLVEEMKTVPVQSKPLLVRAAARARALLPPEIAAPLMQKTK